MPGPSLPPFTVAGSCRPVALVQPGTSLPPAPHAAVEGALSRVGLRWAGGGADAVWADGVVSLDLHDGGEVERRTSRRHGEAAAGADRLALTLTGDQVTAFVREDGAWVARARAELEAPPSGTPEAAGDLAAAGRFGQLGLRDLRLVTHADGSPYRETDGAVLLTATSAGPGGFRTGHTSVWALDPDALDLTHRADLYFRRDGVVHGDHATHLVRDDGRWLVGTSTWSEFDRRRNPRVGIALAESQDDLTSGGHVLDARPWPLPTDAPSVGTWDPHLVRDGERWLVTYVSATAFFRFHPVVAEGPDLDHLRLRAADSRRTATEGPTLTRLDGRWWVLASDGRDGRRRQRAQYPVLDLDLRQHGVLDADYPSNLPWPTLLPTDSGYLLVGFDGTPAGGPLLEYGSHGGVSFQRGRNP